MVTALVYGARLLFIGVLQPHHVTNGNLLLPLCARGTRCTLRVSALCTSTASLSLSLFVLLVIARHSLHQGRSKGMLQAFSVLIKSLLSPRKQFNLLLLQRLVGC